jgi:hypothetical protein
MRPARLWSSISGDNGSDPVVKAAASAALVGANKNSGFTLTVSELVKHVIDFVGDIQIAACIN